MFRQSSPFSVFRLQKLMLGLVFISCWLLSMGSDAAEVQVKMLNKAADGSMMVFEPALVKISVGDSVHFVATDKSHDVQSIDGMIPEGATAFSGKPNQDVTVKFDKAGIYAYRCRPHYVMGMAGLVVVGEPSNAATIKKALETNTPPLAKARLVKLLATLDVK